MVSETLTEYRRHQLNQGLRESGLEQRAALRVVEQSGELAHSATDVLTPKTDAENTVDDLAMLVRKLVRHLPEGADLRVQAVDYLHRKGLLGSPLR